MTLGQSLFNALKGKLIRTTFLLMIVWNLEDLAVETVRQYHQTGMVQPFKSLDSIVFTSHVARTLREVYDAGVRRRRYVEINDNRGVPVFLTWETLVETIVTKLRRHGYSNIERAVDDIIFAVMCLAFWNDLQFMMSPPERRIRAISFVNLLQLALDALSSVPPPETNAAGGSGEPQPEAEAHGGGSGEPQPEAEAHGGGSGEPQPEEKAVDVPLYAGTVRGVRRYRLRDTPQRELSRQRRARSRYGLRDTPARRER